MLAIAGLAGLIFQIFRSFPPISAHLDDSGLSAPFDKLRMTRLMNRLSGTYPPKCVHFCPIVSDFALLAGCCRPVGTTPVFA